MSVTLKVQSRRVRPRTAPDWLGVYRSDKNFKVPENLRDELKEIAGVHETKGRAMLKEVREVLSMFPDMERALDRQAPRPSHKLKLLMPLLKIPSRKRSFEYQEWLLQARVLAE